MQRFRSILLVLGPDGQETVALEKAVSLVRKNGGRLTLFSVLNKPPGLHGYSEPIAQHQLESAIAERREWLRGLMIPWQSEDIDVEINVVEGTSFLKIIRQVLLEEHDLVITTAEKRNKGIRARLFGSTSMHLMRKCPCPVWVVKREQTRPYTRILAAVDPSVHDAEQNSLNQLILQLAGSMAYKEAAELHVVHVWHLFDGHYVRVEGGEVNEEKVEAKERHKRRLDTLLGRVEFTGPKPQLHLIEGDPGDRIAELVAELDIDLLVMGTVCRTGIAGFLIGNTAEEVFNQVNCSVLTLKPDGFATPVTLE